jgi:hypothetical protein
MSRKSSYVYCNYYFFQFCNVTKVVIIDKSISSNSHIKNSENKKFLYNFGYLLEPCIEIWVILKVFCKLKTCIEFAIENIQYFTTVPSFAPKKRLVQWNQSNDSISYPNHRILNQGRNPINSLKAFIFWAKFCNLETKGKCWCNKVQRLFFGKNWPIVNHIK